MKRIMSATLGCLILLPAFAQIQKGRIIYEKTVQLQINLETGDEAMAGMIPKTRTDRFELLYGNNQSLWQRLEDNQGNDMQFNDGNGAEIRMIMPGNDDILFHNFTDDKKVEQREFFGKNFLVADSIKKLDWKLSDETKTILGYTCKKATAQRIQSRMAINNDNGVITREEIKDTSLIVAWYTNAIGSFAGPDVYQGQLPGTILEINENDGRMVITAKEISDKVDTASIKEPKGGKKYTATEFEVERKKMMDEMDKNGGGNINIRIN